MATPQRLQPGQRLADDDALNTALATPQWQTTTGLTALAGSLAAATPVLNLGSNVVSTSTSSGTDGVALPKAVPGSVIFVANTSGYTITIFAGLGSGNFINATSSTTSITLDNNKRLMLVAVNATSWYTILTA